MRSHQFWGRCRASHPDGVPVFMRGPWFGYRASVRWSLGGRSAVTLADWVQFREEGTPTLVRYRHPVHLRGHGHPFPEYLLEESGLRAEEDRRLM